MILTQGEILPDYVNLEEAKKLLRARKIYLGTVMVSVWGVVGVIEMMVLPRLQKLYQDFNQGLTGTVGQPSYVLAGIMLIVTVILGTPLLSGRLDEELEKKSQSSVHPGMVKTGEIMEGKYELVVLLGMGLAIAYLVMTTIMPIYQLTSSY